MCQDYHLTPLTEIFCHVLTLGYFTQQLWMTVYGSQ